MRRSDQLEGLNILKALSSLYSFRQAEISSAKVLDFPWFQADWQAGFQASAGTIGTFNFTSGEREWKHLKLSKMWHEINIP